ncbi:MAG: DNA polymerase III subunit delta [Ruminococcaceae bacterium]|nr:DNA polymerase III subunit delta [Oscillospiraceae bacterium]
MDIIKEADFRREIKSKPKSAYLFFGEEDYLKSHALNAAKDALCPDITFAMFNQMAFDALSYSADALIDAIMPMPMMADRKLITVTGLNLNAFKPAEANALCQALSMLDEYDYNTVIISVASDRFDYGILPKRPSKLLSKLSEFLTPVYFEKISPARLYTWVGKHYSHNGVSASAEICKLTVDRCGRDMFSLSSETDKISFYVLAQGRNEVTPDDVVKVSVPAAEFDAFAFSNALTSGNRERALAVLGDMKFRRVDPIIIMSEIISNICDALSVELLAADGRTSYEISDALRMHEYKVSLLLKSKRGVDRLKNMLEKCRTADLELKMSRDGYTTLEKLICTI